MPFHRNQHFDYVTLTSELDFFYENMNLVKFDFWDLSASALIFHMNVSSDMLFWWEPVFLTCYLGV